MTSPSGASAIFCHVNYVFCIMEDVNDSIQDTGLAPAGQGAVSSDGTGRGGAGAAGGVQSIERAFDLLEMLACPNSPPCPASRCPPCTG
jgi:hypothetical protein